MKNQRVVIVILSLLVLVLGYFAFSNRKSPAEMPQANSGGTWQTNTLEKWFTNTVERWRTNTMELSVTNTVLQPITNEVVKEVPAKLSIDERNAGLAGYKYARAPMLDNSADTLYKLGPVALDVYVDASASSGLGQNADELRKKVEGALRAQNIPVSEKSAKVLRVHMRPLWTMSDPRVAFVRCTLDLKDTASLQRQNDIIKCDSIVWSTSSAGFVRTINISESVDKCLQESLDRFCKDYREAKDKEKEIESRMPKVSPDFLSGGQ